MPDAQGFLWSLMAASWCRFRTAQADDINAAYAEITPPAGLPRTSWRSCLLIMYGPASIFFHARRLSDSWAARRSTSSART